MSRMGDLLIDIEEMLEAGFTVDQISDTLNCPAKWVADVQLELNGPMDPEEYCTEPLQDIHF